MNTLRVWGSKVLVLGVAMLAAIGGWEVYKATLDLPRLAQAQSGDNEEVLTIVRRIDRNVSVVEDEDLGRFLFARLHFKCYQVTPGGPALNEDVTVFDQFHPPTPTKGGGEKLTVKVPHLLCTPALKVREEEPKKG